jgi:hypothetical protein
VISPTHRTGGDRTFAAMDDHGRDDEDGALSVQLDVHLDRQPVTGRVRTARGADERFVGWLGFVDALKRVHEASRHVHRHRDEEQ